MLDSIIILGVIISIIFYEWTEISPGGIIVPGYIALFLDNPKRILITIILSIITFAVVKLLSNYIILYGRRKFSIFIITSFFLRYLMTLFFQITDLPIATTLIIGYLVPGIIARDMERQGIIKTFAAMFTVAFLLKFAMIIYGA